MLPYQVPFRALHSNKYAAWCSVFSPLVSTGYSPLHDSMALFFFAYLARQNDMKSLPFASATPFDCVGKEGSFQSRHLFDAPKEKTDVYTLNVLWRRTGYE